jgi:hypothetical protein
MNLAEGRIAAIATTVRLLWFRAIVVMQRQRFFFMGYYCFGYQILLRFDLWDLNRPGGRWMAPMRPR